jgi:hypothetical protein
MTSLAAESYPATTLGLPPSVSAAPEPDQRLACVSRIAENAPETYRAEK